MKAREFELSSEHVGKLVEPKEWDQFIQRVIPTLNDLQVVLEVLSALHNAPFLQLKFLQCAIAQHDFFAWVKTNNDFLAIYYSFSDSFYADIFAGTNQFYQAYGEITAPYMRSMSLRQWMMEHCVHEGELLGLLPASIKNIDQLAKLFSFIPNKWFVFYYQHFHPLIAKESNLALILQQLSLARCDRLLEIVSAEEGHLSMPQRDVNAALLEDQQLILFKKYYGYPRQTNPQEGILASVATYLDQYVGTYWFANPTDLPAPNIPFMARDTVVVKQIVTNLASLVAKDQLTYLQALKNRLVEMCKTDENYLAIREQMLVPLHLITCYLTHASNVSHLANGLHFLSCFHAMKTSEGLQYALDECLIEEAIRECVKTPEDFKFILANAPLWREKVLISLGARLFDLMNSTEQYDQAAQQDHLFLKTLLEKYVTSPKHLAVLYLLCPPQHLYQTVRGNKTSPAYFEYGHLINSPDALKVFFKNLCLPTSERFVTEMKEWLSDWFDLDAFESACAELGPEQEAKLVKLFSEQEIKYRLGLFAHNTQDASEAVTNYYSI